MKSPIISYIGWLLLLTAIGFYVYGVYEAIHLSLSKKPIGEMAYHPVLSTTVGSIQALLLANLGILLGIAIARPASGVARQLMLNQPVAKAGLGAAIPAPPNIKEKVQLIALVLYVISLIACLIVWVVNDFTTDSTRIVSLIPDSGKMFIGVVLAYLTAVLSNRTGA